MTNDGIHWQLLESAIDFIREGVEAYFDDRRAILNVEPAPFGIPPREPEPRTLSEEDLENLAEGKPTRYTTRPDHAHKYAVLHLHAGCLLLFKERLRREHECLVYKKLDWDQGAEPANQKTVDFDEALSRLRTWAKIELDPESLRTLRSLQKLRNAFEHFEVKLNKHHTEAVVTATVAFAYRFLRTELGTNLEDAVSGPAWRRVRELRDIAERLERERVADWQRRAEEYRSLPATDLRNLIDTEPYHPKHNPDPQELLWCDECDEETVVNVSEDMFVCANPDCRAVLGASRCFRCGEVIIEGGTLCGDCRGYLDHMMSKD